jgi:CBS domain-containing protein
MTTVGEVMSHTLLTAEPTTPLAQAAERMSDRGVGAILVLSNDSVSGILTERDVLRAVADGIDEASTVVRDRMTANPETLDADDTTEHAAVLMIHGGFRHLPVMDHGEVVGVLSIRDLMRVVLDDSVPRGV